MLDCWKIYKPPWKTNGGGGRETGPTSQKEGSAIEATAKRKTHTSSEVKARYNKSIPAICRKVKT